MMSVRSWFALLVFYFAYLALGGFIFQSLEFPEDCEDQKNDQLRRREATKNINVLEGMMSDDQMEVFSKILENLPEITGDLRHTSKSGNGRRSRPLDAEELLFQAFYNESSQNGSTPTDQEDLDLNELDCNKWSYYNSFFFAFTAITTIGYGHLSPETDEGKVACIFYSLLGVPINGILIGSLGGYFKNKLKKFRQNRPHDAGDGDLGRLAMLFLHVLVYLIPGFLVFLLMPSVCFFYVEDGWSYLDSLYFSFITLTTIGFGDFVAGRNFQKAAGEWKFAYEAAIILWIIFGLGYVVMIITIIAEGLSFPARQAAKRLRVAEKQLVSKILKEVVMLRKSNTEHFSPGSSIAIRMQDEHGNEILHDASVSVDDTIKTESDSPKDDVDSGSENMNKSVEEFIEELNHDTITSLHNFMSSALYVQRNMRGRKLTPPAFNFPSNSRTSSISSVCQPAATPESPFRHKSNSFKTSPYTPSSEVSSIDLEERMNHSANDQGDSSANRSVRSSVSSDLHEPHLRPPSGLSILNRRFSRKSSRSSTKSLAPNGAKNEATRRSLSSWSFYGGGSQPHRLLKDDGRSPSLPQVLKGITFEEVLHAVESLGLVDNPSADGSIDEIFANLIPEEK